jgi:hypothetical protein
LIFSEDLPSLLSLTIVTSHNPLATGYGQCILS